MVCGTQKWVLEALMQSSDLHSLDRERDRGGVYEAGSTAVRIPGYPERWQREIPRADGGPGYRESELYGPDWVLAERVRELKIQADALYQFAVLVAAKTNHQLSSYWRGGTSGQAMMDMMIANVVTDTTPSTTTGPSGTDDHAARLQKAFQLVNDFDTQQRVQNFVEGLLGPAQTREQMLARPAQQQEWERLVRQEDLRRAQQPAQRSAPSTLSSAAAAPPSGTTVPASSLASSAPAPPPPAAQGNPAIAGVPPQRARPQGQFRVETAPAQQQAAETRLTKDAASELSQHKKALGPNGQLVYGVDDKWIMLLRLLLRGATEADLKAWGMLYNSPTDDIRQKLAQDPAAYAQYLKDLTTIRSLLRRGEGGADWVRAPQHTGWIFFTESFAGSVASAASEVRSLCQKHWVVDVDLMTHDAVRDAFASLVANKMLKGKASAYGRYGGTTNMQQSHAREHDGLLRLFRRLTRKSNDMLAFDGQIDTGGDAMRAATTRSRRDYMEQNERYYSDIYRY